MAFGSRLSSERRGTGPTGVDRMEGNCWAIRLCFSGLSQIVQVKRMVRKQETFFL
jgi:hypothetical protein